MKTESVLARALIAALLLLPVLWALQIMVSHWVAVPWWDEWLTPGEALTSYYRGTLHLSELWRQHNESRKLFPRLLYLGLYLPAGWDVRYGMVLTFAWVCAGSIGLYLLLRQGVSGPIALAGFIFMNLLLFSPRQYENFLYSIEGENFTPAFALIFALLCNLRVKSFRNRALLNGFLALVSTYTCANGMLLWFLAWPLALGSLEPVRQRRLWRFVYLLTAVVAVTLYFVGYRHPPETPSFVFGGSQLPRVLHYLAIWLGNLFISPAPAIVGIVVLTAFIGLAVITVSKSWRSDYTRSCYPWLALGSYALISGAITASGRVGYGVGVAFDVRYVAFSVFLYVAIIGLCCCLWQQTEGWSYLKAAALTGGSLLILGGWLFTYGKEMPLLGSRTAEQKHLELVTRWSLAIPTNPDLKLLSPYPETLERISILSQHQRLRPPPVSAALVKLVNQTPVPDKTVAGYLDEVTLKSGGRLLVQGWAQLPRLVVPADGVVLGYNDGQGRWSPFGVIATGTNRPDVAEALHQPGLSTAGFSHTFVGTEFPTDALTIEARAIDLQHKAVFRVSGTFGVPRQRTSNLPFRRRPALVLGPMPLIRDVSDIPQNELNCRFPSDADKGAIKEPVRRAVPSLL